MNNKLIVEFLGTAFFLYVILKTGSAIPIGIALVIAIMVGGGISGGHFNPAVSTMMAMAGKLPKSELFGYVGAQVLGGLAALQVYNMTK
jgi:aquaporin Z